MDITDAERLEYLEDKEPCPCSRCQNLWCCRYCRGCQCCCRCGECLSAKDIAEEIAEIRAAAT